MIVIFFWWLLFGNGVVIFDSVYQYGMFSFQNDGISFNFVDAIFI